MRLGPGAAAPRSSDAAFQTRDLTTNNQQVEGENKIDWLTRAALPIGGLRTGNAESPGVAVLTFNFSNKAPRPTVMEATDVEAVLSLLDDIEPRRAPLPTGPDCCDEVSSVLSLTASPAAEDSPGCFVRPFNAANNAAPLPPGQPRPPGGGSPLAPSILSERTLGPSSSQCRVNQIITNSFSLKFV